MKRQLRFHLNCVCSLEKCLIKCIVFSHNTNTVLFLLINLMVLYYTFLFHDVRNVEQICSLTRLFLVPDTDLLRLQHAWCDG